MIIHTKTWVFHKLLYFLHSGKFCLRVLKAFTIVLFIARSKIFISFLLWSAVRKCFHFSGILQGPILFFVANFLLHSVLSLALISCKIRKTFLPSQYSFLSCLLRVRVELIGIHCNLWSRTASKVILDESVISGFISNWSQRHRCCRNPSALLPKTESPKWKNNS